MLFNSLQFLVFFPIVVGLYFAMPYRFRWVLLLLASYYFYMCWKVEYIVLIMFSTVVDYFCARRMEVLPEKSRRKKYLWISLFSNLGILFGFKYFNFLNDSVRAVFDQFNVFYNVPMFKVLLPVGISFYTFQTLGYTIDVFNGKTKAEKHFGRFALFVSFFPQLVAGPIERSYNLLPQFKKKFDFNYERVKSGLLLMAWGFFKKVVIADRAAIFVELVYDNHESYYGFWQFMGTLMFSFQVYCDFSGYSDIAIGAALVMGYKLMENFRRPFFARNMNEFWQRWHISLSTWFKDYVYIPLGGSRVVKWRWRYNLFITFALSGLWHGAAWTYVLWGSICGLIVVLEDVTFKLRKGWRKSLGLETRPIIKRIWQSGITFIMFTLTCVFFRSESMDKALDIFANMASITQSGLTLVSGGTYYLYNFAIVCFFILLMESVHYLQETRGPVRAQLAKQPAYIRWTVYVLFIAVILNFGVFTQKEFIYFQF